MTEETTVHGRSMPDVARYHGAPRDRHVGTNELIGTDPAGLEPALQRLFAGDWKKGGVPDKWDGRAGERIAVLLEQLVAQPGS